MDADLTQVYEAIIKMQRPIIPVQVDLWDSETIAAYLKCSPPHVMQKYAPLPDFPQTIRLPTGGGRGTPRWKAVEVIAWAENLKEKRAA